jgi:hypothetical protein
MGVIVVFIWGPPQPELTTGVSIGLEDRTVIDLGTGRTVADHNKEVLGRKRLYSCMSRVGLILIMIGFGFQLWAVWAPLPREVHKTDANSTDTPEKLPTPEVMGEHRSDHT